MESAPEADLILKPQKSPREKKSEGVGVSDMVFGGVLFV